MLFKKDQKIAIQAGKQTLTFRRWANPQAKVGGQYNIPPYGAIEVTDMGTATLQSIIDKDALRAGYKNLDALHKQLSDESKTLYRIEFRFIGKEAVKVPDRTQPDADELDVILKKLSRMDWAHQALTLIFQHEGTRAGDLAPHVGQDTPTFKRNVRKLKQLGLTISLDTGYKLSPRGHAVLKALTQ